MVKKVLIISTSLRGGSNSDILADECAKGASADYLFRDIYMIATAAENDESAFEKAYNGLQGWVDCFEKASLKGMVGGIDAANTAEEHVDIIKYHIDGKPHFVYSWKPMSQKMFKVI